MTSIRLINMTTRLPVDATLEKAFFRIMDPQFCAAVIRQRAHHHVDVHFVGPDDQALTPPDPNLEHRTIDDLGVYSIDYLGVYLPHDTAIHRSIIKVCPERVMAAVQILQKMPKPLPSKQAYLTLLSAVAIHELAHALMDSKPLADICRTVAWDDYWDWPAHDVSPAGNPYADLPITSGAATGTEAQDRYYRQCKAALYLSKHQSISFAEHFPNELDESKWIEESLANAFVLHQRFGDRQMEALRHFTTLQPPEYSAAQKWTGNINQILRTAASWRSYKAIHIDKLNVHWRKIPLPSSLHSLQQAVDRLKSVDQVIESFTFQEGELIQ